MRLLSVSAALLFVSLGLSACGKNFYFAGRSLPPSGILNRVMIAVQNAGVGQLFIVDGNYDVKHNYNDTVPSFSVSGFSGLPLTIQNFPAEQVGLVFSLNTGTLSQVNYQTESATVVQNPPNAYTVPASIFASSSRQYIIAAQQGAHVLQFVDSAIGSFALNLPGVYRTSINASGTIALGFVENEDTVFSVVHLTTAQQQAAALLPPPTGGQHYLGAQDCEPENLPQYCVFQVSAGSAKFDRPMKAVFSPDGSAAYIVNCGPECGGQTAGITAIPLPASALNAGTTGPAGLALTASTFIPVPGGATDALFSGNAMYVAGQQLLPDGLFTGELSVVNPAAGTVSAPIGISDGTHGRMVLADDNTLWIASNLCQGGERYKQSLAGLATPYGCVTAFNTATNTVTAIESYKGDGTGIAAVTGLGKVYTAEGGQVYIYGTANGAALDNVNVTEQGTVVDVAYMDAPDDSDNTWY